MLAFPGQMLPTPGNSDEVVHCFLAREFTTFENLPSVDEDEDLEVLPMSSEELDACLASGDEWLDAKSITAGSRAKQVLGLSRQQNLSCIGTARPETTDNLGLDSAVALS